MYAGPKIIRDGLVFGYDTGANPSSNFDHKSEKRRFFKGRSTENVLDYTTEFNSWTPACNSGDSPTVTANVAPGPRGLASDPLADRIYIPDNGTYPRIYQVFTPTTTSTHKFSIWLRTESGTASTFFGVFRNSPWALPSYTTVSTINTTWQRFELTVNPLDTTSHQIYIGSHDSTKGQTFLMWGAQMEVGTVTSPYITGTRSSTESLINLTKSTTIDVSNVSFGSDGLPTFDGTDDYVDLGADVVISPNNQGWTAEYVFNTNSASTLQHFNSAEADDFNANWLALYNSKLAVWDHGQGTWRYGDTVFSSNTWYHAAFAQTSSTTMQFYVNGEAEGGNHTTFSWSANYSALKTRYIGRYEYNGGYGRYFNGEIPIAKLYNRALTAQEIQQNYKAYKNRFNI